MVKQYFMSLGLSEQKAEHLVEILPISNVQLISQKIEYIKFKFGLSGEKLTKFVSAWPNIFNLTPAMLDRKVAFYMKNLGISAEKFAEMIVKCPFILGYDISPNSPTGVLAKIRNIKTALNIPYETAIKLIKSAPGILCLEPANIERKIAFSQSVFGCDKEDVIKMALGSPRFLLLDPLSVRLKFYHFMYVLGISYEETVDFIKSSPQILNYDKDLIVARIKRYEEIFEITRPEVVAMVVRDSSILRYDAEGESETSIKTKLYYLSQIAQKEDIIKNPELLAAPALKLKTRYLILAQVFDKKRILGSRYLNITETKLWSRWRYIQENNDRPYRLVEQEGLFNQRENVTRQDLLKKYPLTRSDVRELEEGHLSRTGEKLIVDSREMAKIFGEEATADAVNE